MNRDCKDIQAMVVEYAGDLNAIGEGGRRHLEYCDECRRRAADEAALARIFRTASPPADTHLQARVAAALAGVSRRRRWLAAVPAAASMVLILFSLRMLGGIPGGGVATELASRSSGSWLLLVDSALQGLANLVTVARVVSEVMPLPIGLAAATAGLLGLAAITALTRRWKRLPAWLVRS